MSDIYVPGVKSRFNSEKLIEDLMKVERAPKERAEKTVERLQEEKTWWQGVGSRLLALRDSARFLYSFQNPFNERVAFSSNEGALTGTATREASEQERTFTVKQAAQADRFLSDPLEENFKVEAGAYAFSLGKETVSFNFRGGTLREFVEALNRRGGNRLQASLIAVKPGTKSLLIESKITGEANRLTLKDDAEKLGIAVGLIERVRDSYRLLSEGTTRVPAETKKEILLNPPVQFDPALVLRFDVATDFKPDEYVPPQPPPGPAIPGAGSASYQGIVIENDPSSVPVPPWTPPEPPKRVDDPQVLFLRFSDGSSAPLPALGDSKTFEARQYPLEEIAAGKAIAAIEIDNKNTHRDVSIQKIEVLDPKTVAGSKPRNPVSTAQDAIIALEGIEIRRPGNSINDLIPGVTVKVQAPTDFPVKLKIEPNREAVKDAIISLVGNYNRVMSEINVLTRKDERVIEELSYLSAEEQDKVRNRLGVLLGDSTLTQIKSNLQRIVGAPYPTSGEREIALLAQIGIGTDVRHGGASAGYDPSRLRGYLEIDEKALDEALQSHLPAVAQLFGSDTNGDLITDSGVAYGLETLAKPYTETGGIIALKTSNVDTRIDQEKRRIGTLDRQLANKEADLKRQYSQMESAFDRMQQLQGSLDRFSEQNSYNNRR